jgi:hypothetical protein
MRPESVRCGVTAGRRAREGPTPEIEDVVVRCHVGPVAHMIWDVTQLLHEACSEGVVYDIVCHTYD